MDKISQRISLTEKEIRETPYHKGTEHHIGKLKARIARLKDQLLFSGGKKGGGGGGGFSVRKTGDKTVILVGPPSVGKSSLLNLLTNAASKVAAYDFTTTSVIPGMMDYKGAKIQIFDIPGLISGASFGKGRGREIISVIRSADMILLMADIFTSKKIEELKKDLFLAGIRLDEKPADILLKKTRKGGLRVINEQLLTKISAETVKSVLSEFRIRNAEIFIKEDLTLEKLIDWLMQTRIYLPYLTVINKIDINPYFSNKNLKNCLYISCQQKIDLELLRENVWQSLNLIRVYLKEKDKQPDYSNPFILTKGQSLKDLLIKISICNKNSFRKAKIYGPGAKFPGQIISLNFCPQDETIVSFG